MTKEPNSSQVKRRESAHFNFNDLQVEGLNGPEADETEDDGQTIVNISKLDNEFLESEQDAVVVPPPKEEGKDSFGVPIEKKDLDKSVISNIDDDKEDNFTENFLLEENFMDDKFVV